MEKKPRGIRRNRVGNWEVYCRVNGKFYSEQHPPDTTLFALTKLRDALRYRAEHPEAQEASSPTAGATTTFAEDAASYLKTVEALVSYKDRERVILWWVEEFRDRARHSIKPHEIAAVLARWSREGYAPNTVRGARMALAAMWSALDGKSAVNPARDASGPKRPKEEDHALTFAIAEDVIAHVGGPMTRARLRVMLWTGLPPAQIMRLKPEHIDLDGKRIYVRPRRKGSGVSARWVSLLPEAVEALRELIATDALGDYSQSQVCRDWHAACRKEDARRKELQLQPLNLAQTTPYWLRHTFGTEVARATGDMVAVQELMLHSSPEQTSRYIKGAAKARADLAISTMAQRTQ